MLCDSLHITLALIPDSFLKVYIHSPVGFIHNRQCSGVHGFSSDLVLVLWVAKIARAQKDQPRHRDMTGKVYVSYYRPTRFTEVYISSSGRAINISHGVRTLAM